MMETNEENDIKDFYDMEKQLWEIEDYIFKTDMGKLELGRLQSKLAFMRGLVDRKLSKLNEEVLE